MDCVTGRWRKARLHRVHALWLAILLSVLGGCSKAPPPSGSEPAPQADATAERPAQAEVVPAPAAPTGAAVEQPAEEREEVPGESSGTVPETTSGDQPAAATPIPVQPSVKSADIAIGGTAGNLQPGAGCGQGSIMQRPAFRSGESGAGAIQRQEAQVAAVESPEVTAPLPSYPWPPEDPSSLARLDAIHDFSNGGRASLYDVAETLRDALLRAGYPELGYYQAPGGFAIVTRLEGIDTEGRPLGPDRRYRLPDDAVDFSFTDYIRGLFFAPDGYYRLIVFVVTDQAYTTRDQPLDENVALARLRRGAVALPPAYHDKPFTAQHRVDALIYEFHTAAHQVETLRPGRLLPTTHIERTGLLSRLGD